MEFIIQGGIDDQKDKSDLIKILFGQFNRYLEEKVKQYLIKKSQEEKIFRILISRIRPYIRHYED